MRREDLGDLTAFVAVAEERSFTRAAARLGTSQSAVSRTVRRLEERLGLRLLMRTTRSVAPSEAGERLLDALRPAFQDIHDRLDALSALRTKPAGTVRITASENAAEFVLWPALSRFLPDYPDINVEIAVDYALTDIVAARYDAGVRLGEQLAKDMIAVRIGPDMRFAAVAAPAYFAARPRRRRRRSSPTTSASTCACPHPAASTPGSSRRTGTSCACVWRGGSSSTPCSSS